MHWYSADHRRRSHRIEAVLWIGVCIAGAASTTVAQDPAAVIEDSIIKVVELAEPAVVSIARFKPSRIDPVPENPRPFRFERQKRVERQKRDIDLLPNEFGAGCLVSPPNGSDRLVLTNFHVVRGGPVFPNYKTEDDDDMELLVSFSDRRGCRGAIIAADPRSDLAVLRLEWGEAGIKPSDFPSLNWETATAPRKGQFVVLLGNPHAIARDGSASVSWGLVSNLTRQPISHGRNQFLDEEEATKGTMLYRLGAVMQLDARMNLGLSGGPVLNLKGELIGIGTSLAAIEGYEQSVGFALPIDSLTRRIIRTLLAGQEVEYGMLGITPHEIGDEKFQNLKTGLPQRSAALVDKVTRGSPAENARIVPNDVIVKVEGESVRSVMDLMRMVGLHPPDQEIDVTVWRNRTARLDTVRIKLGKWPVRDDEGIIETNPRYAPWRGLSVDYPTARNRFIEGLPDHRLVLVTRVKPNSPSDAVRLEPGNFITHVNNISVQTPAEFHAVVKAAVGPVTLRLLGNPLSDLAEDRHGRLVQVREPAIRE